MSNFVEHFGKFLWIWKAFAIYLILTGIVWLILIGYMEFSKTKENKKKTTEETSIEQDDDIF